MCHHDCLLATVCFGLFLSHALFRGLQLRLYGSRAVYVRLLLVMLIECGLASLFQMFKRAGLLVYICLNRPYLRLG